MHVPTLTITPPKRGYNFPLRHFESYRLDGQQPEWNRSVASFENRVIELCSGTVSAEDHEEVRQLAEELSSQKSKDRSFMNASNN